MNDIYRINRSILNTPDTSMKQFANNKAFQSQAVSRQNSF